MTRATNRCFHAANIAVIGTGLVYAWMRYLSRPDDPFALVNHPWQPHLLHLHVLAAPMLVLMVGIFWQPHAVIHWSTGIREGRRSGISLLLAALPMIASGYLIQTAVEPGWRWTWVGIHLFTSACWIAGSLVHLVVHRRRRTESMLSIRPQGIGSVGDVAPTFEVEPVGRTPGEQPGLRGDPEVTAKNRAY